MINVVYLPYRRHEFADLTFSLLSKCKNKDFHVSVCGFHNKITIHSANRARQLAKRAQDEYGLNASPLIVDAHPRDNYIAKLKAASKLPYKHTMKLDEDVFLSPDTIDFMFDNVTRLVGSNIILTPALSNGVPTCDDFIEHQLDASQTKRLHKAFSGAKVPKNLWSYNWHHINRVIECGYERNKFYAEVAKIKAHYKGIHPIRFDVPSQLMMNEFVLENIGKFTQNKDLEIKSMKAPYFCNSCFIINTDEWKKILYSKYYIDPFDEVPLNRYRNEKKKNFLYMPNCYGIHIMYVLVAMKIGKEKEKEYFKKLYPLIMKQL
ncbi:hypothetical protein LCGC14_0426900 [marine sediment metagenome]|uniref:Glycosyltransferase 2-like domain-containing protein n=1 Tax=marine sediment metagenome TaxID=412755 RepID=A0A0F9VYL6_9ZZZZ